MWYCIVFCAVELMKNYSLNNINYILRSHMKLAKCCNYSWETSQLSQIKRQKVDLLEQVKTKLKDLLVSINSAQFEVCINDGSTVEPR